MAGGDWTGVAPVRLVRRHSYAPIGEVHVGKAGTLLRAHSAAFSKPDRAGGSSQVRLRKTPLGLGELPDGERGWGFCGCLSRTAANLGIAVQSLTVFHPAGRTLAHTIQARFFGAPVRDRLITVGQPEW